MSVNPKLDVVEGHGHVVVIGFGCAPADEVPKMRRTPAAWTTNFEVDRLHRVGPFANSLSQLSDE